MPCLPPRHFSVAREKLRRFSAGGDGRGCYLRRLAASSRHENTLFICHVLLRMDDGDGAAETALNDCKSSKVAPRPRVCDSKACKEPFAGGPFQLCFQNSIPTVNQTIPATMHSVPSQ